MALVKCVECERKISTLADACPHCGAPTRHSAESDDSESGGDTSGCILKLFLIVVVLGLIYLFGKKHIDPILIKVKDKIANQQGGSRASDDGEPPDILGRKNPAATGSDSETEPVDPDMGEKITKGLLHPKVNPGEENGGDDAPPDILGIEKTEPNKPEEPAPTVETTPKTTPETTNPVSPEVQPAPVNPDPKEVGGAQTTPTPPIDPLLAKAGELKLKIVESLIRAPEGMLIVTVNENWPILTSEQKKEAAEAVYNLWTDNGGTTIEFRNAKGDKVASMNLSSKLIHGKVTFVIHDAK